MCMLCVCVYVCVLHDACNTMTLYIFSGEGKKVSTESNPAKILEWNHHPKAQSSWTWWNADVRALSPISLYYTLRGSLCFEAFADEHTFVRSDPLSLGIPWWDPAKFLFYFLSGTFNFSVTFFFFLSCHLVGQIFIIIPDSEMIEDCAGLIVWISRRVGRFRATSGEIAKMEASRVNSGEIGRGIAISPEPARIFPSHSESRDPAYLK